MIAAPTVLFVDYADPISWMLELEVAGLEAETGLGPVRRAPFELRPPPEPLIDTTATWWRARWEEGTALAATLSVELTTPSFVPWTRKAHELRMHAEEKGMGQSTHRALFEAFLRQGRDIGRVDVLIDIAAALGLEVTEAKAVLDVDRFAAAVVRSRDEAAGFGIHEPPALASRGAVLRGFHIRDRLRTFLCSP
jgi:predicted DsbA family dithiol-disulfide isomerase